MVWFQTGYCHKSAEHLERKGIATVCINNLFLNCFSAPPQLWILLKCISGAKICGFKLHIREPEDSLYIGMMWTCNMDYELTLNTLSGATVECKPANEPIINIV